MVPRWIAVGGVCLLGTLVFGGSPGLAQYMFLDVDGDGEYTSIDQYACADTLDIDVYLVTNTTEYGATAVCQQDGSGIDLNSYSINLYATEAPTAFSNFENHMPGMIELEAPSVYPYAFHVAYGGPFSFPPGKHRLFGFRAVGCTTLDIVPYSCYSPPGTVTSFGSSCPGLQSDYTLRLGEDWSGSLGTGVHTDPIGSWPTVTCPAEVIGVEGRPLSFSVTVNDPDCGLWSFYGYNVPQGATLTPLGSFVAGDAKATFVWTPSSGQAGTYAVTFDGSDYPNSFHGITQRDTCTTVITIRATTTAVASDVPVRIFPSSETGLTALPRGESLTCFQIESVPEAPFSPDKIVWATVRVRSTDPQYSGMDVPSKESMPVVDTDHNGVPEFGACFWREALEDRVDGFSPGVHTIPLRLSGQLTDGSRFHGEVMHAFVVAGGRLAVSVSPNPVQRGSTLEFTTKKAGSMNARLYDIRGRFVATLVEIPSIEPGTHSMPLPNLEALRDRLASGIYFIRIAAEHDASETRRVTILK